MGSTRPPTKAASRPARTREANERISDQGSKLADVIVCNLAKRQNLGHLPN